MHRPAFNGQNSFAQALAERGVWMDGLDDFVGGQLTAHGKGVFTDQVGGVGTNDVSAENLAILANDDFGKTFGIADGYSLADSGPGETLDSGVGILLFGLSFGQADKADLREGVDRVGNNSV